MLWLLVPMAAQAQGAAGVLNAFGLFGRWAMRCDAPPAAGNIVETVAWSGREPVEFTASGAFTNRYRVVSATMPNAATLAIEVELNGRGVENLTIVRSGTNSIRTMWNRSERGFLVREGIVAATGEPTPWLYRCP
ncbi:MAG: hypothetical protein ACM3JG_14475 [Thiohalocapsa sp.]